MEERITVEEVVQGKFGEQVKYNGQYYSYGKFYKGSKLKAGKSYTLDLFVSEKGNRYINKVISNGDGEVKKSPKRGRKPKVTAETYTSVTGTNIVTPTVVKIRDFDAEARGKTRCALMEATLQSPLLPLMVTNPHDSDEVKRVAELLCNMGFVYVFPEQE